MTYYSIYYRHDDRTILQGFTVEECDVNGGEHAGWQSHQVGTCCVTLEVDNDVFKFESKDLSFTMSKNQFLRMNGADVSGNADRMITLYNNLKFT